MDPISLIVGLLPMLSGLFGSSGGTGSGAGSLFSDPNIGGLLKQTMFGADARSLPYIDPQTGQVTFEKNGTTAPSLLGLQYADALRNDPLKAAITRMAGGLLPTNAGFGTGAFATVPHASTFTPNDPNGPPPNSPANQGTPDTAGRSGPPGDQTGPGASPRNRGVSMSRSPLAPPSLMPATPSLSDLLTQLRGVGAPA